MIIKDSIRFVIASIAMVLFVLFGCGARTVYAETSVPKPEMKKSITCTDKENDIYELSLSMQTTSEIINQTAPLDVIFVADLSGSMDEKLSQIGGARTTRLEALKNALAADGGLIENVLSNSNNRLSIISFAGGTKDTDNNHSDSPYNDAKTVLSWSNDITKAKKNANELAVPKNGDTGTNISAGLYEAEQVLKSARDEAKKVIVLLTDGEANMYYDDNGDTQYDSNNPSESFVKEINESLKKEVNKLKAHKLDGFYSIAFAGKTAITSLEVIHAALGNDVANATFTAGNESDLLKCFEKITEITKTLMFQHVVITDILSDWVELVSDEVSDFSVVKKTYNSAGEVTNSKELTEGFTIKITTTENDKTQVQAVFNEDYVFDDCCTYILKFKVRISQDGYDEFADTGCDQLPSNAGATVSYTYDSHTQEIPFEEKPQVNSVTLEIPVKVEWDLLTDGKIPETSVTVELFQDEKEKSYRTESVGADESWQGTFTKLAKGHEYKKAKAEEIEGFTVTTELKEENGKKYFLVKYVQLPSLTISKTLIEEGKEVESGDSGEPFVMTVTLKDKEGKALTGEYGGQTFTNGQTTVSVSAGKSIKLAYLPRGTQYTVVETDSSSAGYDVAYENKEGKLEKTDQTVTVTNTKLPSLTISKTVAGDYGDKGREFAFTIKLTKDGSDVSGQFTMTKGEEDSEVTFDNGTATVTLKHDENVVIKDLPLGADYTVEETAESRSGYTVTYNGTNDKATGKLTKSATVAVVNTMGDISSTGGNSSHGSAVKLGVIGGLAVLVTLALVARKVRKDDL